MIEKISLNKEIKLLFLQILKAGDATRVQVEELLTYFVDNQLIKREIELSDEQFKQSLMELKPKNTLQ